MTITEYFGKLRTVIDELALAGSHITNLDFITHMISRLDQPYYPVVIYIETNIMKMSINEARIESNQLNAIKEAKLNYTANIAQTGPNNNKKPAN